MRTINWPDLLRQYHVDFAEGGRNVSKGYIAVKCPFCGHADESHHMSINLSRGSWHCWRDPSHRGRDPIFLLAPLLRVSPTYIRSLLGEDYVITPDDLLSSVRSKLFPEAHVPVELDLPEEFRLLRNEPPARRFLVYLRQRGFFDDAPVLGSRYGLRYCTHGRWQDRIIFPVWYNMQLMAWTARSILPNPVLRYMTEGQIGDYLLWFDQLKKSKCHTIVLCEGPFDALKIRVLGRKLGITATCWFTALPSQPQIQMLYELLPHFRKRVLILDNDARARSLAASQVLASLEVQRGGLPAGFKDPGELDKRGFLALVEEQKMR